VFSFSRWPFWSSNCIALHCWMAQAVNVRNAYPHAFDSRIGWHMPDLLFNEIDVQHCYVRRWYDVTWYDKSPLVTHADVDYGVCHSKADRPTAAAVIDIYIRTTNSSTHVNICNDRCLCTLTTWSSGWGQTNSNLSSSRARRVDDLICT